ncbi:hypothetical protein BKA83DRAFT_4123676 [Pisolithus microcarpus]|nr:hypothetical protein BKA83DRAFT_4123676 [Pisolithus microcarpus]
MTPSSCDPVGMEARYDHSGTATHWDTFLSRCPIYGFGIQYALLLFVWFHKQSLTVSHDLTSGLQAIKPESFATAQEIIFLAHQGQSLRGISNAIGRHLYAIFPTCAWAVLPLISTTTARNDQEVNLSLLDMKNNPIPSQSMYTNQKGANKKAEVMQRPHFQ